jgi:EmrB/QacA subfamily drug resistance transporter
MGSGAVPSLAFRVREALRIGYEPAPSQSVTSLSYYPWLVVGTTCISAFMGQIDASIVQLALPTLERVFHARLGAVSWVAIGYSVAFASILPVFARLAEMFGRKLLYLVGFALFTVASALCGFSSSLPQLIAFRVLQGVGGAMLGANSVVILVNAAGPGRRGRAMGIFAAAQAVGVSLGPAAGGLLLGVLDWRWLFWATEPFGLAGVALGWLVVPKTTNLGAEKRFDWMGAVLLTPALVSAVIVFSESYTWGPSSAALLGSAFAAVVLLSLFVRHERRAPAPLIDLHLFRVRAFSGGVIAVVLSYALLYGIFFLMSFALVRGYHDSSLSAGLRLAITPVALGIVAPFSGALYERLGPRVVAVSGMAICLAALFFLSRALTDLSGSAGGVMAALALFGVGLGTFIAPNNSGTMAAAPAERRGQAGGLLNLGRVLGTSFGVAVTSSVLPWKLRALTGVGDRTVGVSANVFREAVNGVLPVLAAFAVIAGAASLFRSKPGQE